MKASTGTNGNDGLKPAEDTRPIDKPVKLLPRSSPRRKNRRFKCRVCHSWTIQRGTKKTTRIACFPDYGKICIECANQEWLKYIRGQRIDRQPEKTIEDDNPATVGTPREDSPGSWESVPKLWDDADTIRSY